MVGIIGAIIEAYTAKRLVIVAAKSVTMDKTTAENFYGVHKDKPFFEELVQEMTAGPCLLLVLEGDDAIQEVRQINGATNPLEAKERTLRRQFARPEKGPHNAVHGSDSEESARKEIGYFFPNLVSTN